MSDGKGSPGGALFTRLRRHPLALPLGALALGCIVAKLVATWAPVVGASRHTIPPGLAEWLGSPQAAAIVLTRPSVLWLLPIALFPFLIAVVWRSLVDLRPAQVLVQLLIRATVLMSLAFALAQPTLRAPLRGKTVVFAVDVSKSMSPEQLEQAAKIVGQARELMRAEAELDLPREDRTRLRVVTYAARARAFDLPEAGENAAPLRFEHPTDGDLASDHAAGLRLAEYHRRKPLVEALFV